jgi:hypothetical protein
MKFETTTELYLTFLTHNDSYMKKIPEGSILTLENGDLCYEGKASIDDTVEYLNAGFIVEIC